MPISRVSVLLLLGLATCESPREAPRYRPDDPEAALDWTIGRWEGVRRAAADGSEAPMTMEVEVVLGGAGQTREIEIVSDDGEVYRGFCVQVFAPERGVWVRQYANDVRRSFARLEGTVDGTSSTWSSATPGRTRESLLCSERVPGGRWRRTMSISGDAGATWRELWVDELVRMESR